VQLLLSIVLSYQYPPSEFFLFGVGCRSDNSPGYGQNDTSRKPGSARFGNPPQIKRIPTADIGKTVQWIGATAQELGDSSLNQPKTGKTEHCPFLFSIIFFFLYICKKIQFFPYL
jgi:hypothetical protein